jgi:hypothetical protein
MNHLKRETKFSTLKIFTIEISIMSDFLFGNVNGKKTQTELAETDFFI